MRRIEFTFQNLTNYLGTTKERFRHGRLHYRMLAMLSLSLLAGLGNGAYAQCALVCNDNVNVSLPGPNANCELEILVEMVLEEPYTCPNPLEVSLMNLQGVPLPTSPVVNASHIGGTFIFQVWEPASGNSCWGTFNVEDKLGPQILNCGNHSIPCLADYLPSTEGGDVPAPDFDDCSTIIDISYSDAITLGNCNTGYVSIVNRTWTAADAGGYTSTCTQTITVERVTLATYTPVCPANVFLECGNGNPNTNPSVTGYPVITVGGIPYNVIPGANNFCEIAASYSDEVFDICGGGQKILRTWNIYDWCLPTNPANGNPFTCIQVIKIQDTTPPVLVCPAPITHGSSANSCSASLTLPPASVSDACSSVTVKVLTPWGAINGNGGPLLNVPVGTHNITYVATDACGNISSCTTTLTVVDDTPPVAVCDEHTVVSLSADGLATVSASVFDDGSSDNCGVDYFEVSRMPSNCMPAGTPYGAYAIFECCDVGEALVVSMRVFDDAGNYNECMVNVEVQDKINPTIICPPNFTIQCTAPMPAPADPVVNDNCPGVTWVLVETNNLTNCGVGTILRKYTATDASGRTANCTQTISVINSNPFNIVNIVWPLDYVTNECGPALEPSDLPPGYNVPVINEDNCDLVAVTHEDQLLNMNAPACFKILRKWIVIDWCQYNPNIPGSPGYFEHTQILKVIDTVAPVLTCPGNTVVSSLDPVCGYGMVSLSSAIAIDCSSNFLWTTTVDYQSNGSVDQVGSNPNLSGSYPFGLHFATIKAEDYCGNSATCTFTIKVKDGKKPTPICVNGLAVELMSDPAGNGGMVILTPAMFNQGSFDNCTAPGNLQFSLSPNIFTCTEVGTNIVTLYVTDAAGNTDYCETYVIIQDNLVICPGNLTADVGGNVANTAGSGVQNVLLEVSGNGPLTAPVMTDQNGHFQFFDLDLGYDYTFTPGNNQNPLNGVTTYDLVLMTRHILNIELLDSPYKLIAGDVNKNGTITTADVVELRKLILQIIPQFSNNNSWRFVDADYVFSNPQNPFQPPFPEFYNINDLADDNNNVDFVAVKTGDVNQSAVTHNFGDQSGDRNADDFLSFVVDDGTLSAGETFTVAFKAKNFVNLLGYQFALKFDPNAVQLEDIKPGELANLSEANFGLTMLEQGIITTSWDNSKNTLHDDNTVLFSLVFRANTKGSISELFQISNNTLKAEAYQSNNNTVDLLGVNLQFSNQLTAATDFELYQNNPNPFRDNTAIGFRLPEASTATLTVYDMSGKVMTTITGNFAEGYNEIQLQNQELGSAGVLFYELETPTQTATRRMVRL